MTTAKTAAMMTATMTTAMNTHEMPTTTTAMTANEMPATMTAMMTAMMTTMMQPPAGDFFGHCTYCHAQRKAKAAQYAGLCQADITSANAKAETDPDAYYLEALHTTSLLSTQVI